MFVSNGNSEFVGTGIFAKTASQVTALAFGNPGSVAQQEESTSTVRLILFCSYFLSFSTRQPLSGTRSLHCTEPHIAGGE